MSRKNNVFCLRSRISKLVNFNNILWSTSPNLIPNYPSHIIARDYKSYFAAFSKTNQGKEKSL